MTLISTRVLTCSPPDWLDRPDWHGLDSIQRVHQGNSADTHVLLDQTLASINTRVIACSGGIDSLLLATMAHRASPEATTVAHTVTAAVPAAATARVVAFAEREGWKLELLRSNEFDDERYLANPTDRCYYCKTNLYDAIADVRTVAAVDAVILSGANTDDLGEYRPGLIAADEHEVRHPYIEAGWGKAEIREQARALGLAEAELPASPCLASRIYTGTRVTAARLQAIEAGEMIVTELTGVEVVRCRVRESQVLIEVSEADRALLTSEVVAAVHTAMVAIEPGLGATAIDDKPYRPGRAFLQVRS